MRKILAVLALALVASQAQAQSRFVADGVQDVLYRDGVATYGDNNGLTALSWFRFVNKFDGSVLVTLVQVHCDTGMHRTIRSVDYRGGVSVRSTMENWSAAWENQIPGTLTQRFSAICWSR